MTFLKMKCNSTAKNNIEAMLLTDLSAKYVHLYKSVATWLYEYFFCSYQLNRVKLAFRQTKNTKQRNKLDLREVICYKSTNKTLELKKNLFHLFYNEV